MQLCPQYSKLQQNPFNFQSLQYCIKIQHKNSYPTQSAQAVFYAKKIVP